MEPKLTLLSPATPEGIEGMEGSDPRTPLSGLPFTLGSGDPCQGCTSWSFLKGKEKDTA